MFLKMETEINMFEDFW